MKPKVIRFALVITMAVLALFLFLPSRPALAASISISPDDGEVDTILYIDGTGFTPDTTYQIYFAYNTSYEEEASGTVANDGTISQFFSVPEIPGDTYAVRVATSYESAIDIFTLEPEIELSDNSAIVGEEIYINGTGFKANRTVRIKFEGDTVETTSTNSRGSFTDRFRVPEGEHGHHDVSADDNTYRVTADLFIDQSISVAPDFGSTGTEVTVDGTGFRDDHSIIVTFEGEEVDTVPSSVKTDDNGSFTASFDIPICINRNPEIAAGDGRYRATAEFEIVAGISLSPDSGISGEIITVDGHGFRSNRPVVIAFDDEPADTSPSSIRSDETGCFSADIELPSSVNGVHEIIADDGVEVAEASFNTLPGIDLIPTSGPINSEVAVEGSGFDPGKVVTIRFNEEHVRTGATDAQGAFIDIFNVPPSGTGNYNVIASDGANTAGAGFTVTTSIYIDPMEGHVGTLLRVTGHGFSGAVTVRYDEETIATTTADGNGSFSVAFSIPKSIHGHHSIIASDAVNTVETTFTMESTPPPVPVLALPENGSGQGSRPAFDWGSIGDPSGVTYTLQIATDDSFNTLLLEKQGLIQPHYALAGEEGLQQTDSNTPYYWRVKAVDGAENESGWSIPGTLYVRFIPQWAIYIIIASVSVSISVLVSRRVFGKKHK